MLNTLVYACKICLGVDIFKLMPQNTYVSLFVVGFFWWGGGTSSLWSCVHKHLYLPL